MAFPSDRRRASEYALAEKLRNASDEDELDLAKKAFRSFANEMDGGFFVRPSDLREPGPLSPVASYSSSSSASPGPQPNGLGVGDFMSPGRCDGDSDSDSDSDSDIEPLLLTPKNDGFEFHNGRVYSRSALQKTSGALDAPFDPHSSPHHKEDCEVAQQFMIAPEVPSLSEIHTLEQAQESHPVDPAPTSTYPFARRAALKRRVLAEPDSDADDEDKNPTDDEYQPSPPLSPTKRSRTRHITSRTLPRTPTSSSRSPTKRARITPGSRNVQVSSSSALAAAKGSLGEDFDFQCPVCSWKQLNKRMPDFQRHLRTHERPSNDDHNRGWWCKGVPTREQDKHAIPSDAQPYVFRGQLRIGGCQMNFSRRDALKRHLDNPNVTCVGRSTAANDD